MCLYFQTYQIKTLAACTNISFSHRSVVVYNPTEQDRTSVVTVYVNTPHVCVITDHGHPIPAQISAVWDDYTTASTEAFQV